MRPWMIVLSSVVAAVVVAGAMVEPELMGVPPSDFGSIVLAHLSMLAVATLAVYALCALLLATASLTVDGLSLRRRLGRTAGDSRPTPRDWTTALGATELHRLVPFPLVEPSGRAGANDPILLQHPFSATTARGEIARLYYLWLARTHFFSALIVLIALVGLGLAQDHRSVPLSFSEIPTVSAILLVVGLILLAILGRIAIDVSTEPLIEMISPLAAEQAEIALLRRLAEVRERVGTAATVNIGAPGPALQPGRLESVIEEGQRGLAAAARNLSLTTTELGTTIASSIDALKAVISMATAQLPSSALRVDETPGFSELQEAVEALTAALEQLTTVSETTEEPLQGIGQAVRAKIQEPHLARELRRLLQEIGAPR